MMHTPVLYPVNSELGLKSENLLSKDLLVDLERSLRKELPHHALFLCSQKQLFIPFPPEGKGT